MAVVQTPFHIMGEFRRQFVFFLNFFAFYRSVSRPTTYAFHRTFTFGFGAQPCWWIFMHVYRGSESLCTQRRSPFSPTQSSHLRRAVAVSRRQSINLTSCVRKQFRPESSRLSPPPPQRCRISSVLKRKPTVAGLYRMHVTAGGVRHFKRTPVNPTTYRNTSV